ncbi:MAG: EAL domain-containing protein [Pleomorphochaeta sp.]
MKKKVLKDVYNKIEQQIDSILPLVAIISSVIAFSIYFSDIPIIYMYIDLIIAIIFIVLSVFHKKLTMDKKFYTMIVVIITLAILVFFDGGFSTGFIILLTIGNIIPILIFTKKESFFVNIISIMILAILGVWGTLYSNNLYINIGITAWITHVLMFILFFILFRIVFFNIIDTLYNYLEIIEKSNKKIYKLAYYDSLTKLPNQHYLINHINNRSKDINCAYIIIFYIKNLAFINSIYGKEMGDSVILELAKTLQNQEIELNLLAKTAGSELALWIENITDNNMINYLNKIEEIIDKKYRIHKLNHKLDLYVSYTKYEKEKMSPLDCYNKTNIAMTYIKKNNNIKRIEFNDDLEDLIRYNAKLNKLVEEAIEKKAFTISYQTKISAKDTEIIGAEALARWYSPIIGNVSPGVFVPIIEELDKSAQFGELIIDKVFQEYNKLCKKYNKKIQVSINISPSHLIHIDFINYLKTKLNEYEIDGENIIIEITEEVIIMGINEINKTLSEIKALGINVSIDDFGTGYSSFSYLESLKVDEIKIDKSFIDKININERSAIVIKNIITLAKQLNLKVVAEGVETKDQYESLLNLQCDFIQGYYFSKPEPL